MLVLAAGFWRKRLHLLGTSVEPRLWDVNLKECDYLPYSRAQPFLGLGSFRAAEHLGSPYRI